MSNAVVKVPYAIRYMLRALLVKSKGLDDLTAKVTLEADDIHLLADFVVAGWLKTGFRNPRCFGIQPSKDREIELEYVFFQAARITFEHLMLMQFLPEARPVAGVDLAELNRFILDMSPRVFNFWSDLVKIDMSEVTSTPINKTESGPQLIDTCLFRIDDLELLYYHCDYCYHNQSELIAD